ncbi:hypothetical protein DN730_14170 [Marinomonas piezotolerans]|uniref:PilZ domain-containing protein n=1 Tax=Marinomonas piezotolerans TaxID=2213058 RepID=A0A370U6S7_9GAMM|nr:hypothetical protein DN730_14170 [Marinomonas piezotolerans]
MLLDFNVVKTHHPYVRCFWIGTMYLTNGTKMRVHCTHISHDLIEVEAPLGLQGSKKVKLELEASHESARSLIKIICYPSFDVLNEHDKHYIKMSIHTISDKDREFIDKFVKAHN